MVAQSRHERIIYYVYGVYYLAASIATHVGAFWDWQYTVNFT